LGTQRLHELVEVGDSRIIKDMGRTSHGFLLWCLSALSPVGELVVSILCTARPR
jgi:hypothetical protein